MYSIPMVTICIPTFNGAAFLQECLDCAIQQTYPNLEILIVDDDSTDETIKIIKENIQNEQRIRLLQNNVRLGLVGNWNKCIENAKGEWIKFLFQDDIMADNCVEKLIDHILKHPSPPMAAFCQREFFYDGEGSGCDFSKKMKRRKFIWDIYPEKTLFQPKDTLRIFQQWKRHNVFGEPTSYIINKDVFSAIGLFDNAFQHICDLEFWYRMGINFSVAMLPETLVKFRLHNHSTTSFNRENKYLDFKYFDSIRLYDKFLNNIHFQSFRGQVGPTLAKKYLRSLLAIAARRARIDIAKKNDASWREAFTRFSSEVEDVEKLSRTPYLLLAVKFSLFSVLIKLKCFAL